MNVANFVRKYGHNSDRATRKGAKAFDSSKKFIAFLYEVINIPQQMAGSWISQKKRSNPMWRPYRQIILVQKLLQFLK